MTMDVSYLAAGKREECRSSSTATVDNDKAGYTPGLRKKVRPARRQKSISHRDASLRKMRPQRSDARSFIKKLIAVDGRYIPRCIPHRWILRRNAVDKTHTSVSLLWYSETMFGERNSNGLETFRRRKDDACRIFTQVKYLFWLRKVFRLSCSPNVMFISFISCLNKQIFNILPSARDENTNRNLQFAGDAKFPEAILP